MSSVSLIDEWLFVDMIDRLTELLDENGKMFISKLYDSMQGWQDMRKCEDCVYYDELKTEQPCCGCVDFVNFERDHQTGEGGEG